MNERAEMENTLEIGKDLWSGERKQFDMIFSRYDFSQLNKYSNRIGIGLQGWSIECAVKWLSVNILCKLSVCFGSSSGFVLFARRHCYS